jgi:2-oxoglutarate dehydrogenase E1 component
MAEDLEKSFWNSLQDRLNLVKETDLPYSLQASEKSWEKMKFNFNEKDFESSPKTGIAKNKITQILKHLSSVPEGMTPLSKVNRLMKNTNKLIDNNMLDWALAELMAYGSILLDNKNVRMSGQDVKRGTFSHRHLIFRDANNYNQINRLEGISDKQGKMMIYNSLLSEFAVLGFEYGYSLASPETLVLWEAQFGDFANGAQTIFDQFVSAAESKWQRMSGLVMLLPHGYEGQGPEHSSAKLERYLQATAEANFTVANMTTPANFFHALRRQMSRDTRKPLVVMSPKSMLRHPKAVSPIEDFETGSAFQEVIDDPKATAKKTNRLLFCSGKLYYDLLNAKEENKKDDVAIVRIEQLYPFPETKVNAILEKYKSAEKFWVQEESSNMGAWDFLMRYWRRKDIELISRDRTASPATGFKKIHEQQQAEIIAKAVL